MRLILIIGAFSFGGYKLTKVDNSHIIILTMLLIVLIYIRVDNVSDVNELLEEAIIETDNLNEGEVFLVKDLFKGYVWNRIPRKNRLLLETLFLNWINKMDGNIKAI